MNLKRDGTTWLLDTGRPVAGFDNLRIVWSGTPPREGAMSAEKLSRMPVVGPDGSDELQAFLDQLPESAVKVESGGNGIPKAKSRRRQASAGVVAGVSGRPPRMPTPARWEGWKNEATQIAAKWIIKEKYVNQHFSSLAHILWSELYLDASTESASVSAREQLAVDIKNAVSDAIKLTEENPNTLWRDLLAMALRDVDWLELADKFLQNCRNYESLATFWGAV